MTTLSRFGDKRAPITDEMRERGRQTRLARIAEREARKSSLKLDYLDASHWADLASRHKIRMPHAEEAVDVPTLRKYLGRCNVPVDTWNEHYTSMKFFAEKNPTWTKYAAVGLILELKEEYKL